jgi:hypothetical protein
MRQNTGSASKRRSVHQSMLPSRLTSAAPWQSRIAA